MQMGHLHIRYWAALAVCLSACASAQAQSSWWDKYATPEPKAVTAKPTPATKRRSDPVCCPGISVPYFGAVKLIGPDGRLIPGNIIKHLHPDGPYIVETQKGTQIVYCGQIANPLQCPYPERRRRH